MRIALNFGLLHKNNITIPINYSYPLSSWIYHTIANGNHEFAQFLHNTGFVTGNKQYKLFTFSNLKFSPRGFKVEGDRLQILNGECQLIVSFQAPEVLENFILGLFKGQEFSIGDKKSKAYFAVKAVEALPKPRFQEKEKFRCLSPILVSQEAPNSRYAEYLDPNHTNFTEILVGNLVNKLTAAISAKLFDANPNATKQEIDVKLKVLNTPKSRVMVIKANTPQQTKLKGYYFDFEIDAPRELIEIGYNAGFGEKNALGLGCVQLL